MPRRPTRYALMALLPPAPNAEGGNEGATWVLGGWREVGLKGAELHLLEENKGLVAFRS